MEPRDFGVISAAASQGLDWRECRSVLAAADALQKSYGSEDIKLAACIAKTAFEESGMVDTEDYRIFSALADAQNPAGTSPEQRAWASKYASVVFTCLGRVQRDKHADALYKSANTATTLGSTVSGFAQKFLSGLGAAKDVTMAGLGGAGLLGGVGGAGLWGLQRALDKPDTDLEELEAQRDVYVRLSKEVRDELARRRMAPTPGNVAKVVDYLT